MLTQERLKELLSYDPETGLFTWLQSGPGRRLDLVAGNLMSIGYITIRIDGKLYYAHRLACLYMKGRWPTHEMDHINHNRDDNRWLNIRETTHKDNGRNASMPCTNTSGHVGVCFDMSRGKWLAYIHVDDKMKNLGYFNDKSESIAIRKTAEITHGYHVNHGKKES